jgi:hypothetical protein
VNAVAHPQLWLDSGVHSRVYSSCGTSSGYNSFRQVQELGFSLQEVWGLLVLRSGSLESCSRVRGLLEQKLAKMRHHIHQLRKLENELKSAVQECDFAQKKGRLNRRRCPVLEQMGHKRMEKK